MCCFFCNTIRDSRQFTEKLQVVAASFKNLVKFIVKICVCPVNALTLSCFPFLIPGCCLLHELFIAGNQNPLSQLNAESKPHHGRIWFRYLIYIYCIANHPLFPDVTAKHVFIKTNIFTLLIKEKQIFHCYNFRHIGSTINKILQNWD